MSEEHSGGREGNVVQNGTAEAPRAAGPTDPAITKVPPPPKHKNNADVNVRELTRFSGLGERRAEALSAGHDADSEIAEAMLGIARMRRLLCVTEEQSDLGCAAHIDAVLRRIRCNEPGAAVLDGHYILTEDAHTEELAMVERRLRGIERGEEA